MEEIQSTIRALIERIQHADTIEAVALLERKVAMLKERAAIVAAMSPVVKAITMPHMDDDDRWQKYWQAMEKQQATITFRKNRQPNIQQMVTIDYSALEARLMAGLAETVKGDVKGVQKVQDELLLAGMDVKTAERVTANLTRHFEEAQKQDAHDAATQAVKLRQEFGGLPTP